MFNRMRAAAAAVAFAVGLGLAVGAHAQSAEAESLGREVAQRLLEALPLKELLARSMGTEFLTKDVPQRPEWTTYMTEAAGEEFTADVPQFADLIGHGLAKEMTLDELRAGIELFRGPAGESMTRVIAASANKGAAAKPSPELEAAYKRVLAKPAGRGFLDKLGNMEKLMEPMTSDAMVILLPGMMRRFGEKAEAGERARKAASAH